MNEEKNRQDDFDEFPFEWQMRQKILQKLQVSNSIEACKIAKELGPI